MHRTYIDKIYLKQYIDSGKILLDNNTVKRFIKILRTKPEELIAMFDGDGLEISGHIKNNYFEIKTIIHNQPPEKKIILLQGALCEDKIEETVKRTTEYGIDDIVIFNAQRSEAFIFEKLKKKYERLVGIAIDASRQSGRFFVPKITLSENLKTAVKDFDNKYNLGIMGVLGEKQSILQSIKDLSNNINTTFICVGPEGGLSGDEIALLKQKEFNSAVWAPFVLRSELSSLAPLAILNETWRSQHDLNVRPQV